MDALDGPPPCPVCGAPGGNCGPVDGSPGPHARDVAFREWSEEYRPPPERTPSMADVVATTRIFEDLPIPRTKKRTRRVLRYTPGQVVPEEAARRLHVGKDGKQKKVPTAAVDETGAIPLGGR